MDSIQDLREHGGSVSDLKIQVENRYRSGEVRFFRWLRPELSVYSLSDQERWSVYSRIKAIFDARSLVFKNAIADLPGTVQFILYLLVIIGIPTMIEILTWKQPGKSSLLVIVGYWSVIALTGFVLYRPSRVFLVDSHERTKLTADARRGYVRDIAMLVLGVIITKFGELLIVELFR
jgi:NADH:ubiquinone oxidoreductase subunit 4 (subunit M)